MTRHRSNRNFALTASVLALSCGETAGDAADGRSGAGGEAPGDSGPSRDADADAGGGAVEAGSDGAGGSGGSVGPVAPLPERFSVGPDFVCAVSRAGVLDCWGPGAANLVEELGAGDNRAVSVGAQYSCVLKRNGTPVCTGFLGGFGAPPLIQLDVGSGSFCGIDAEGGSVVCRGSETRDVPAGLIASDISVAGVFACAVASDAGLSCWGIDQNDLGLLEPRAGSFSRVSAYLDNACAVGDLGRVQCWGYGLVDPAPDGEFESVALGLERACALGADGLAACWGFAEPADLAGIPLLAIDVGSTLVCGVLPEGRIQCFGEDAIELPADAMVD